MKYEPTIGEFAKYELVWREKGQEHIWSPTLRCVCGDEIQPGKVNEHYTNCTTAQIHVAQKRMEA